MWQSVKDNGKTIMSKKSKKAAGYNKQKHKQEEISKSKKENLTMKFIKKNIWNLFGVVIPTLALLMGVTKVIFSRNFSISCADFYGVDKKYFVGTEMLEGNLLFLADAILLFVSPYIFMYVTIKNNIMEKAKEIIPIE